MYCQVSQLLFEDQCNGQGLFKDGTVRGCGNRNSGSLVLRRFTNVLLGLMLLAVAILVATACSGRALQHLWRKADEGARVPPIPQLSPQVKGDVTLVKPTIGTQQNADTMNINYYSDRESARKIRGWGGAGYVHWTAFVKKNLAPTVDCEMSKWKGGPENEFKSQLWQGSGMGNYEFTYFLLGFPEAPKKLILTWEAPVMHKEEWGNLFRTGYPKVVIEAVPFQDVHIVNYKKLANCPPEYLCKPAIRLPPMDGRPGENTCANSTLGTRKYVSLPADAEHVGDFSGELAVVTAVDMSDFKGAANYFRLWVEFGPVDFDGLAWAGYQNKRMNLLSWNHQ